MDARSVMQDEGRSSVTPQLWWLVGALSAVLVFESMFFTALAPLLPHYVESIGISHTQAGILAGADAAGTFVAALPAGMLASRWGYKRTVLLSTSMVGICAIGFGFAQEFWLLGSLRFAQGCASATVWTGAFAWLVSASPIHRRGQVIGTALGAAAAGSLLGPLLGGVASEVGTGPTFACVGLLFVPLALMVMSLPAPSQAQAQRLRLALASARHPRVLLGFWLMLLAGLAIGALAVIVPLRLAALGWSAFAISAAFVTGATVEFAANPLVGRWSDLHGRRIPVLAALASLGALFVLFPLPTQPLALSALLVVATAGVGTLFVLAATLVSEGADAAKLDRGLSSSVLEVAWAPGNASGSIVAGALFDRSGILLACMLPALLCFGTLATLWNRRTGRAAL